MTIRRIILERIRNIDHIDLTLGPGIHYVFGDNGSGKSSLIEALYFASHARSFRAPKTNVIIQNQAEHASIALDIDNHQSLDHQTIVWQLSRQRTTSVKLDGHAQEQLSHVIRQTPAVFIDTSSHRRLAAESQYRRDILNWCAFYTDPSFSLHLTRYKKALQQRNQLLKSYDFHPQQLTPWNQLLHQHGHAIHDIQTAVLQQLHDIVSHTWPQVSAKPEPIALQFSPGWTTTSDIEAMLHHNIDIDRRRGFTTSGPHRSDILVTTSDQLPAFHHFSQGQQKSLAYSLKLAQAHVLLKHIGHAPLILIDDINAELDQGMQYKILHYIQQHFQQALITAIHQPSGQQDYLTSIHRLSHGTLEHYEP